MNSRFANILTHLRIITGLAYYAISLYSTSFSEDRFINTLLIGVSEFPAQFLAYFAAKYTGRTRAAFFLMFACGTSSLVLPFISAPGKEFLPFRSPLESSGIDKKRLRILSMEIKIVDIYHDNYQDEAYEVELINLRNAIGRKLTLRTLSIMLT